MLKQLTLLLFFVGTLGSCSPFKIPEYKDFQNLRLESIGLNETTVYMELLYNNPNRIGFQMQHTEADVYVDNVYLGRAYSDTLIKVARKADFIIPLRIKTDMKNIFKNAWSAISSRQVTVYMELLYNNPNRIGFQVQHTEADVYVDNVYLGRAYSDTLIKVARKADFIIPLRIKTDMKNIFKNAWSAISSRQVTVRANGTIRAGVGGLFKTIPLAYEGKHELGILAP